MNNIGATVQGTFSTRGWQRRAMRLALVVFGCWLTVSGVEPDIGWTVFLMLISKPYAVIGMLMAVFGALLTSGMERPK